MITRFGDGRDWFFEKRFGLFIHWGLYAIPAWHEQLQWRGGVPRSEYEKLIRRFNPVRFNADQWLDLAEGAGMQYLCVTAKHHDGFCLWDTATTDYNVMRSPYGRDILATLAEACGRRGFPLCLYYSVVDWHHPNYPNQNRSHELPGPEPGDRPDIDQFIAFLRRQVRELCTRYGQLGGFWWDMNVTGIKDPSINAMVRELQPGAIINNRGFDEGDFGTPEREMDKYVDEVVAFDKPTEACQSVGMESWGYKKDEDYYADRFLMQSIDKILAKGGNYLLNVGPKADGTIPAAGRRIVRKIGRWYRVVREAFEGVLPASQFTDNRNVLLTRKGNTLYVHLHKEPIGQAVQLPPLCGLPRSAVLLNTGRPIEVRNDPLPSRFQQPNRACLRLRNLPVNDMADTVLVAKLEFDGEPG